MGRKQRIITTVLWGMLVLVMVGVVIGQFFVPRAQGRALPEFYPAAHFSLIDQSGNPFSDHDLAGHPYISTFIFTHCTGSCPLISAKMAQLQKLTPADVKLISFSVDPMNDTPAVLDQYARNYQADPTRWHLLTGTVSQMQDVSDDLKVTVRNGNVPSPLVHSTNFFLVDGRGMVRGIYDSQSESSVQQLIDDARQLSAGS